MLLDGQERFSVDQGQREAAEQFSLLSEWRRKFGGGSGGRKLTLLLCSDLSCQKGSAKHFHPNSPCAASQVKKKVAGER